MLPLVSDISVHPDNIIHVIRKLNSIKPANRERYAASCTTYSPCHWCDDQDDIYIYILFAVLNLPCASTWNRASGTIGTTHREVLYSAPNKVLCLFAASDTSSVSMVPVGS